jgi:hypothetical protein
VKTVLTRSDTLTTGMVLAIFAGFWLALSACMPAAHSLPRAWKPVVVARAFESASRPEQAIKVAAAPAGSRGDMSLAKATVPSDAGLSINQ